MAKMEEALAAAKAKYDEALADASATLQKSLNEAMKAFEKSIDATSVATSAKNSPCLKFNLQQVQPLLWLLLRGLVQAVALEELHLLHLLKPPVLKRVAGADKGSTTIN
jgi:hypothetical protein